MSDFTSKVTGIAQNTHDINATVDQFGVSQTPYHTHNGADSPPLSFQNLTNRKEFVTSILPGTSPVTAGNYGTFFIAPMPCTFIGASEVHQTAGSDSSAVFLQIEKLTGTTASGSGTNLLLYGLTGATVSSGGSGYAVDDTITLTGGTGTKAILKVLTLSGSAVATVSITNQGVYTVLPANPVSQGSSSGAGTGAQFNLTFVNGFNLKGTANTVQTAALARTTNTTFNLAKNDRLGLVLLGTPTSIAQVVVVVQLSY